METERTFRVRVVGLEECHYEKDGRHMLTVLLPTGARGEAVPVPRVAVPFLAAALGDQRWINLTLRGGVTEDARGALTYVSAETIVLRSGFVELPGAGA